jgi:hypothetical protein
MKNSKPRTKRTAYPILSITQEDIINELEGKEYIKETDILKDLNPDLMKLLAEEIGMYICESGVWDDAIDFIVEQGYLDKLIKR